VLLSFLSNAYRLNVFAIVQVFASNSHVCDRRDLTVKRKFRWNQCSLSVYIIGMLWQKCVWCKEDMYI